jgi:glycosyltransferase involved in cell wall biosynthesis
MNRLEDLKVTLPLNLVANVDYSNLEFIILDYNSKDGLGNWIKDNMMEYIKIGRVVYYRLEGPKYYSMTHSRNVAFRIASGDIVCSLDADNFTFDGRPASMSWAHWLNHQAHQHPEKTVFLKSRQIHIMHGRLGFYKHEFINLLGGYDEELTGYGYDDQDIRFRAEALGFHLCKWGNYYFDRIQTPNEKKNTNLKEHWKDTRDANQELSEKKIANGILKANKGKHWGKAELIKNFKGRIEI